MRSISVAAAVAAAILAAGAALAQQAAPPAGPGTAAGPGPRDGHRPGVGPRVGADFTPGWAMMSRAERDAHRQQMMGATSADDCRRIRDEHLKLMAERARERGMGNMPIGRRDACAKFAP